MSKIKFLKSHEWYNPESNTVGISDFAQRELGDIVFVELPQVGESVEAGKLLATWSRSRRSRRYTAP